MVIAELDPQALEGNWGERRRQDLDSFMKRFTMIEVSRDLCRKRAVPLRPGLSRAGIRHAAQFFFGLPSGKRRGS